MEDTQLAFDFEAGRTAEGGSPEVPPALRATVKVSAPTATRKPRAAKRLCGLLALERPPADARPETLLGCAAWLVGRFGASDKETKEIVGAVRTIIRVAHKIRDLAAQDLPARPTELRPHLRDAMPAAIGVRVAASATRNRS